MTLSPCLAPDCGEPTEGPRCPDHRTTTARPSRAAGYDTAWDRLSKRARKLHPWCTDCGATTDLTADHSPEAWERHDAGLPIRLVDVDVVCRSCNGRRGAARARKPLGGRGQPRGLGAKGEAKFRSLFAGERRVLTDERPDEAAGRIDGNVRPSVLPRPMDDQVAAGVDLYVIGFGVDLPGSDGLVGESGENHSDSHTRSLS